MDICIDTNVFTGNGDFFKWIGSNDVKAYLSAVSYMELVYHAIKKHGSSVGRLNSLLRGIDAEIIPFDSNLAALAGKMATKKYDFSKNSIDYIIGVSALKSNIPLVTYNKKHFTWLSAVYTPAEIMEKYP